MINTKNSTFKNLTIRFELFQTNGNKVNINGKSYFERKIGIIKPKEKISRKINFKIGLSDAIALKRDGEAKTTFKINFDENKTVFIKNTVKIP